MKKESGMNKGVNLSQTGILYNPHFFDDELTEKLFVARQKHFEYLLHKITQEKEHSIPQHHIIIGRRGLGKTMFLKRIEVELHKEQYRLRFIPLLYREEQYNVHDIPGFWLNTLDALADCLKLENYPVQMIAGIENAITEFSGKPPHIITEDAYSYLMNLCNNLNRRPVLLIDNIDIVFSRFNTTNDDYKGLWALRKILSENGAPIVVGAGNSLNAHFSDYSMPFYDFFLTQQLYKLNYEEFTKILINLATITNCGTFIHDSINDSRHRVFYELTEGNPRITVMLFEQIAQDFPSNIYDNLIKIVDSITPIYKAQFEEMSTQQQIIIDAIALNWDAISLHELSMATRLRNNQLSPQLIRLVDGGWLETTPAQKAKGNAYLLRDRLFNMYYLLRYGSRRHKKIVYSLVEQKMDEYRIP